MQIKKKGGLFMKKKMKSNIPAFSSKAEEAKFWETHSFADYWDALEDVDLKVELKKPRNETLVLRLQGGIKDKLEDIAKSRGINVSTLARMWLIERLQA